MDGEKQEREVLTVGHSDHPMDVFVQLLRGQEVTVVADVRSSPYSGYAPQFNQAALAGFLERAGIGYVFLGNALGGLPRDQSLYDPSGRVSYEAMAESPAFRDGLRQLLALIAGGRVALLCGEEDPRECHRRLLVGRVLRRGGVCVLHLRGDGRVESEDRLLAREEGGQSTFFDREVLTPWKSTRSVSQRKRPPTSSSPSGGRESAG